MSFLSNTPDVAEREEIPLETLSQELQVSKHTLLRWVDRHLIDATVRWVLTGDNEEQRIIEIRKDKHAEIEAFAAEYRHAAVSRKEARHMLRMIDRRRVKRLVRAGDLETVEIDEETKVRVASIEDYLIAREQARDEDAV